MVFVRIFYVEERKKMNVSMSLRVSRGNYFCLLIMVDVMMMGFEQPRYIFLILIRVCIE